jgi:hypothetical protein
MGGVCPGAAVLPRARRADAIVSPYWRGYPNWPSNKNGPNSTVMRVNRRFDLVPRMFRCPADKGRLLSQRLIQVGDQIRRRLKSDRQPDHVRPGARCKPLLVC